MTAPALPYQGRAGTPGPNPPLRGPSRGQAPASTSETAHVFRERTKEKL